MSFFDKLMEKQESKLGEYSLESNKEEIIKLRSILNKEEICNLIISVFYLNRAWILAITDLRLIFIRKKFNKEIVEKIFLLDDLGKVIVKKGMLMSNVEIELDNENIVIENINSTFLDAFLKLLKKEFISKKEYELNKKNKLKEEKQREFERIMASNPELSEETKRNIEKAKSVPKELSKRQKEKQYQKDRLKQLKRDHIPYCPKCKSTSLTYINKKLSIGRAVTGKMLFGSDGAILGGLTSKKGYVKCLNCGHKWKL